MWQHVKKSIPFFFLFHFIKAKTEAVVEKPLPKKVEKVVKEAPPAKEAPAKEENGAKKGRGRPPKATVAKKSPPKRAAPTASGKGEA